MTRSALDLGTIVLLDKVQKGVRIAADEARRLKAVGLVEGRYPNLIVAGPVAAVTGQKAQHIRNRGFDSRYYRDMIVALRLSADGRGPPPDSPPPGCRASSTGR